MKYFILLLSLNTLIFATDFQDYSKAVQYKALDEKFTLNCACGKPAILLPYYGEDIPIAKTEPCLSNGCNVNS